MCFCIKDGVFIDLCCGSGGMFVQSTKFIDRHAGNRKNISIYGQESNPRRRLGAIGYEI
jgi:type I restriction enzyme M protein